MPDPSQLSTEQLLAELLSRQRQPVQAPISPGETTVTVRHIRENQDSIEIGTAGKGGVLKVYYDSGSSDDAIRMRIDTAIRARAYAQLKLQEP